MKIRIALALDEELLQRVDETRGDVPRARFIQRALEAALDPPIPNPPPPKRPASSPKLGVRPIPKKG